VDEEEVLWSAFQFFDKDGNGDISVAELRSTISELGGFLTDEELQTFISIMDVNNDGVIGVGSFTLELSLLHARNDGHRMYDILKVKASVSC
jgi:calmodulin